MTKDQIKHMVDRFLNWRLPENFNPDGGISFKATFNEHTVHPMRHEPVGTNLFDAGQAEEMVRHMIEGLPSQSERPMSENELLSHLRKLRMDLLANGDVGGAEVILEALRALTPSAHVANEWADMATNGIQWLRNIRDGISTPEDALAEMESNLKCIRGLITPVAKADSKAEQGVQLSRPEPASPDAARPGAIECMDCHRVYGDLMPISLNIPRDQWLAIHPEDGGVLCANCLIVRASKLEHVINVTGKITFAKDYDEAPTTDAARLADELERLASGAGQVTDWALLSLVRINAPAIVKALREMK